MPVEYFWSEHFGSGNVLRGFTWGSIINLHRLPSQMKKLAGVQSIWWSRLRSYSQRQSLLRPRQRDSQTLRFHDSRLFSKSQRDTSPAMVLVVPRHQLRCHCWEPSVEGRSLSGLFLSYRLERRTWWVLNPSRVHWSGRGWPEAEAQALTVPCQPPCFWLLSPPCVHKGVSLRLHGLPISFSLGHIACNIKIKYNF